MHFGGFKLKMHSRDERDLIYNLFFINETIVLCSKIFSILKKIYNTEKNNVNREQITTTLK